MNLNIVKLCGMIYSYSLCVDVSGRNYYKNELIKEQPYEFQDLLKKIFNKIDDIRLSIYDLDEKSYEASGIKSIFEEFESILNKEGEKS